MSGEEKRSLQDEIPPKKRKGQMVVQMEDCINLSTDEKRCLCETQFWR